jgi:hypothetical protein
MIDAMVVVLVFVAVGMGWMMVCNTRTYNMRTKIIDNWTKVDDWREAATAFRSVSYTKHEWHVATFRDPRKLYPPIIWQAMGWKGIGELDTPETHAAYIRERINPILHQTSPDELSRLTMEDVRQHIKPVEDDTK